MGESGLSAALIVNYCFCLWPIKPAQLWKNVANNIEAAPFTSGTKWKVASVHVYTDIQKQSPLCYIRPGGALFGCKAQVFPDENSLCNKYPHASKGQRAALHTHFVLQCVESSVTETEHWTNACSTSTCACTKRYHQKLCWHEQLMCSETKSADRWQINLWFTAERFCCQPCLRIRLNFQRCAVFDTCPIYIT